ncbi:MAG: acylphosphatase [Bacteroidetes bacterium]|nr:acylphosphatase [Bacteroidota bacterium]
MEKRIKITIRGFVQGIGFRFFTLSMANEFGIKGFVKNLYNGDVEAEAQSTPGLLNDFVSELKIGPRGSSITSVFVEEIPMVQNETEFRIE